MREVDGRWGLGEKVELAAGVIIAFLEGHKRVCGGAFEAEGGG